MRNILVLSWLITGALFLVVPVRAAESPLASSQTAFERWVDLQQSIAEEKSDWAVEKEYLSEEIRLLREEMEALTEKEKGLKESTDTIEAELKDIAGENEALEAASKLVEEHLPDLESDIHTLNRAFPVSLQATIDTLVDRLPKEGASKLPSVSERLQVIVGVLGQVDKFNGQLSVQTETQANAAGEKVQVQVLYLGLGHGWFVNKDDKFAGYGQPGDDGWVWTYDDSIAPAVRQAIKVYENSAVAEFVSLPVSFK